MSLAVDRPQHAVPAPAGSVWWWPPGTELPGLRPALFFPPSGAEPTFARTLVPHAAGLRFGVLQLAGRGARRAEPPPTDLREVVQSTADAVTRLDGPPAVLIGHSFGGLLAYSVATELEERGTPAARLILLAASSPSAWEEDLRAASKFEEFVRHRTDQALLNVGVPAELLAHRDFGARARALIEVDLRLSVGGFGSRPLRTPVTAILAHDDTVLRPGASDDWARIAVGEFTRIDVPGGHFFYRAAPQRLLAHIRMELQSLDGGYDTP